jgi:hypothetical protein
LREFASSGAKVGQAKMQIYNMYAALPSHLRGIAPIQWRQRHIGPTREDKSMSIFSKIKDAIFGKKAVAATPAPEAPVIAAPVEAVPVAMSEIDVIAHLEEIDATDGRNLNWRSSIVDLMKMLGMESSLQERKDLAMELGYTGELEGSAEMNMWLHKAVMRELAANGGVVPAELMD